MFALCVCLCSPLPLGTASVLGDPSDPQPAMPGDAQREAVRECAGPEAWTQAMGGNVDGVMCRSPVGYAAFTQHWQPNVEASIANIGDTPISSPRLVVNSSRDWRSVEAIADEAASGYQDIGDRARAIYEFQRRRRFHACTWDRECSDAAKMYNCYGYTLCGNDAIVLSDLWQAAGIPNRRGRPIGHSTAEAFFGGRWHLLDGDEHCIYLLRDNETIASEEDIVRDHDLVKRTHTYGILRSDNPLTDQFSASLYSFTGERTPQRLSGPSTHTMDWVLLPGMTMTWRWSHVGKQYSAGDTSVDGYKKDGDGDLLRGWGPNAYANMCNGLLTYEPDLASEAGRLGIVAKDNLAEPDGGAPALKPAENGRAATATWKIATPHPIVGLKVDATALVASADDRVALSYSADGEEFSPVAAAEGAGRAALSAVLDEAVSPRGKPQYAVWLRAEMESSGGGTGIETLSIAVDLQTSMLSLPELELGENMVEYRDDSDGPRRVRVSQRWIERTAVAPPPVPARPVHPALGETVEGTRVRFEWEPAGADDVRWPLSPNFEKLVSHTAQRGTCAYELPYEGLLNPDRTYYWRVRAENRDRVWGQWSDVWAFQCDAPSRPLHVRVEPTDDGRHLVLRWAPNPMGRPPVRYRVYASDEQGFSASDEAHRVDFGMGFVRTMEEYDARAEDENWSRHVDWPANYLLTTEDTSAVVAGPDSVEGGNKAFYRVVAVDDRGTPSGPSDLAEAPRPWLFTESPTRVAAGEEYRYGPGVITSIGHLISKPGYKAAYWEKEYPVFSLVAGPEWLSIDADTGILSGVAEAGEHHVTVEIAAPVGMARQSYVLAVE